MEVYFTTQDKNEDNYERSERKCRNEDWNNRLRKELRNKSKEM